MVWVETGDYAMFGLCDALSRLLRRGLYRIH
jgi:hypothetical protein